MGFFRWLSLGRRKKKSRLSVEELRSAFTARYHYFKLLLNANNEALEAMVDIEEALRGKRPFGMRFVRACCTRVSKSVFQIIKHLNSLAPGKYEALYDRFKDIQAGINKSILPRRREDDGPLVLTLSESNRDMIDLAGPKMANLGELRNRLGVRTPDGFVVTSAAYCLFMRKSGLQDEINRLIQTSGLDNMGSGKTDDLYRLSSSIQQLIIDAPLPCEVEEAVMAGYAALETSQGKGINVAVRSSAQGEDLAGTSFAGQYKSILNVGAENLFQTYKEVVASKYSLQAVAYRLARGIRDEDVAMCVGCLPMITAESGGVVYTRSPVDPGDDRVYIHSNWGLPKAVVDGSADTDVFVVDRHGELSIIRSDVANKEISFVCNPGEGVCRSESPGEASSKPSLSTEQILELARTALRLEECYGSAVDMEWAVDGQGEIIVLQCRPLTSALSGEGLEEAVERSAFSDSLIMEGGVPVSPGASSGLVYIVRKDADVLGFPKGGVLVVLQAMPRWAALLGKASAVLAEQGGAAGHLASVAREFGVPAVFGLKGAVEGLENGQVVTVDADHVSVYKDRIEELLTVRPEQNLMKGSPVFSALRQVARLIIRLRLLNPESPDFRPSNCKTLHDITRFCHEKAVTEMFSFGTDHDFPQAAAKQLVCDVPMQFWVVNLDDGFTEEVNGPKVDFKQIASIPMRALWQGMVAKPWAGPPPVNAKGFMSVMFEATANPALDPAMGSHFTAKNYFTISSNYCSLQSRFGFHFCGAEALVSERANENYASFQFKGGAANRDRRIRRAKFVAELLEEFDFRAKVREDSTRARIEGFEREFMENRLNILGYLVIHTRQLDMIMGDSASVARHRAKIINDIKDLFPVR